MNSRQRRARDWPPYMSRERTLQTGRAVQVVRCTNPDCSEVGSLSRTAVYPADVFEAKMTERGWTFPRREALCPACSSARRMAAEVITPTPAPSATNVVALHATSIAPSEPVPEVPMSQQLTTCQEGIRLSLSAESSAMVLRMLLREEHRDHLDTDRVHVSVTPDGLVEVYPALHEHAPVHALNPQQCGDEDVWRIEAEVDAETPIPSSTSIVEVWRTPDAVPYLVVLPVDERRDPVRVEDRCAAPTPAPVAVRARARAEPEPYVPPVPYRDLEAAADEILKQQRVSRRQEGGVAWRQRQRHKLVHDMLKPAYARTLELAASPDLLEATIGRLSMPSGSHRDAAAVALYETRSAEDRPRSAHWQRVLRCGQAQGFDLPAFVEWALSFPELGGETVIHNLAAQLNARPHIVSTQEEPMKPIAAVVSGPEGLGKTASPPAGLQPKPVSSLDEQLSEIKAAFALVNDLIAASGGRIQPRIEDGMLRASVVTTVHI